MGVFLHSYSIFWHANAVNFINVSTFYFIIIIFVCCIRIYTFFFNFFIKSLGVSHHIPQLFSPLVSSYSPMIPVASFPQKKTKQSKKTKKQKQEQKEEKKNPLNKDRTTTTTKTTSETEKSLILLSCLSTTSLPILMAVEASVCRIVYVFAHQLDW